MLPFQILIFFIFASLIHATEEDDRDDEDFYASIDIPESDLVEYTMAPIRFKRVYKLNSKKRDVAVVEGIEAESTEVTIEAITEPEENPEEVVDINDYDSDLSQITEAIRDVAFYLRAHKFNEYDRRYSTGPNNSSKYFYAFPDPPLRAIHWEVKANCEDDFLECLMYLWTKSREAIFKKEDDSNLIMLRQNWTLARDTNQVLVLDATCRQVLRVDELLGNPFQGPLERFQWRTSASYYMCWYTFRQNPLLRYFNESCDNFANCLDPKLGPSNHDPRANDSQPFQCALYSFCPDPCCSLKHTDTMERCWIDISNPCPNLTRGASGHCSVDFDANKDFQDFYLNRWNVSCECESSGFVWSSMFGICVDVNECGGESGPSEFKSSFSYSPGPFSQSTNQSNGPDFPCEPETEMCLNLPGSYRCVCGWGYFWDPHTNRCVMNEVFEQLDDVLEELDEVEDNTSKHLLEILWERISDGFEWIKGHS